jgi:hypothetical protein
VFLSGGSVRFCPGCAFETPLNRSRAVSRDPPQEGRPSGLAGSCSLETPIGSPIYFGNTMQNSSFRNSTTFASPVGRALRKARYPKVPSALVVYRRQITSKFGANFGRFVRKGFAPWRKKSPGKCSALQPTLADSGITSMLLFAAIRPSMTDVTKGSTNQSTRFVADSKEPTQTGSGRRSVTASRPLKPPVTPSVYWSYKDSRSAAVSSELWFRG